MQIRIVARLGDDVEMSWDPKSPSRVLISRSPDPDDDEDLGTFQAVSVDSLREALVELERIAGAIQ